MDLPIRKFVLWKCRNLDVMRDNLEKLIERKQEILDESGGTHDGLPRAKYRVSDMVSDKAIRREQLDFAIKKVEYEIKTITEFQKSLTGYERELYDETIAKHCNIIAKADLMQKSKNKVVDDRNKLLRQVATRLGEFVDRE